MRRESRLKDGDRYVVLVECRECGRRRLQNETWGDYWEVVHCSCGGRSRVIMRKDDPKKNIHAPENCLLTWDEM